MTPENVIKKLTTGKTITAQNMKGVLEYCKRASREQIARKAAETRKESNNFCRHSAWTMHVLQCEADLMDAYLASTADD